MTAFKDQRLTHFRAIAVALTMLSSPALAQEAEPTLTPLMRDPSIGARDVIPENYREMMERGEGLVDLITQAQFFAVIYKDRVISATPSIMAFAQEKDFGQEFEKAFADHGDRFQIVSLTMRKDKDGYAWTPVDIKPLRSGKDVAQATILSLGPPPQATFAPAPDKNDFSFYMTVARENDGTWKLFPSPLPYDEQIRQNASSQYESTKAEYERQDMARDFLRRGRDNLTAGHFEEARRDFGMAATMYPSIPDGLIGQGVANYDLHNYDDAIIVFDKAIALGAKGAAVYEQRAASYMYKKEYARAIADYSRALTRGPTTAQIYVARSQAYRSIDDRDHALADLNQAIRLEPSKDNLTERATLYYEARNYPAATSDFNAALKLDPKYEGAVSGLERTQAAIKSAAVAAPASPPRHPFPRRGIGPAPFGGPVIIIPINPRPSWQGTIQLIPH